MHGYLLILLTKAINHLSYVGWSLGRKLQPPTSCPSLSSLKGTMLVLVGQNQNSSWSKCHKWNKPWSNRGASISAWSHQKKHWEPKKLDTLQIQFVGPRPHPPLIHWACRLECRDAKLPMHLRKPRDAAMMQTHLAGGHPWATRLGEVAKRNIYNGNIEYIDSLERS